MDGKTLDSARGVCFALRAWVSVREGAEHYPSSMQSRPRSLCCLLLLIFFFFCLIVYCLLSSSTFPAPITITPFPWIFFSHIPCLFVSPTHLSPTPFPAFFVSRSVLCLFDRIINATSRVFTVTRDVGLC